MTGQTSVSRTSRRERDPDSFGLDSGVGIGPLRLFHFVHSGTPSRCHVKTLGVKVDHGLPDVSRYEEVIEKRNSKFIFSCSVATSGS